MFKNSIYSGLSVCFTLIFGLVTTRFFSEALGPSGFGELAIKQATIYLFASYFKINSPRTFAPLFNKYKQKGNLNKSLLYLRQGEILDLFGIILGFIIYVLLFFIFFQEKIDLINFILFLAFAFDSLNLSLESFLSTRLKFYNLMIINLSYTFVKFSGALYLYININNFKYSSLFIVSFIFLISSFTRYIMYKFFTQMEVKSIFKNNPMTYFQAIKNLNINDEFFSRNKRSYFDNLVRVISRNFDYVLLGYYFNNSDVGLYKIARQILGLFEMPIQWLNNFIYPYISGEKIKNTYQETLKYGLLFLGILPTIIFYFFGYGIINLIFGNEFLLAYEMTNIILFAIFIYSISLLYNMKLVIKNKTHIIGFSFLIGTIIQLFLIVILSSFQDIFYMSFSFIALTLISSLFPRFIVKVIKL